jgi:hypothetical protein
LHILDTEVVEQESEDTLEDVSGDFWGREVVGGKPTASDSTVIMLVGRRDREEYAGQTCVPAPTHFGGYELRIVLARLKLCSAPNYFST